MACKKKCGGGKKKGIVLAATLAAFALTGCGHNAITYGKGVGFETTLNPETFAFGVTLRYGEILSAVVKEKSEVSLTTKVESDTETQQAADLGTKTVLTFKTGDQITGYTVDMEEAKHGD